MRLKQLFKAVCHKKTQISLGHRESTPQFENQIMAWLYARSITRSTTYQKAPFCQPELAHGKLVM